MFTQEAKNVRDFNNITITQSRNHIIYIFLNI